MFMSETYKEFNVSQISVLYSKAQLVCVCVVVSSCVFNNSFINK